MQIRVERPRNRVWVLEDNVLELNNLTCSTWGNMHNVHTCKMAQEAKIVEVETNSNSCKFESSDLEIGCGCWKKLFQIK